MARQPFERKSLWHLSAPCYLIHISMGDNFETACTALRTSVRLGPAKMKKSLPAFKVFCCSLPFKGTCCLWKGLTSKRWAPATFSSEEKAIREERAVPWRGRDLGRCERDWPLDPESQPGPRLKLLPRAHNRLFPGRRRDSRAP